MRRGALAMLDILGFKARWRHERYRNNSDLLVDEIVSIRSGVDHAIDDDLTAARFPDLPPQELERRRRYRPDVLFVSDTVFIGNAPELDGIPEPARPTFAVRGCAVFVHHAMEIGLRLDPPAVYRGCISYGDFVLREFVAMGEAVDQVAGLAEHADAAVVWVAPLTASQLDPRANSGVGGDLLVPWTVPLKDGGSLDTVVVNPFWMIRRDRAEQLERILGSFDDPSLGVQIKKQNTEKFLRHALAFTEDYARRFGGR